MRQYEGRQWMVDPECPSWAKLRRAESLIDVIWHASMRSTEQGVAGRFVRETLKRPWSTRSDSLSRSGPTSPSWSATRSAICGRHSTGLPISWRAALWSAHRGCRANDGVTDSHLRRAVRRLGDFEEQQTKLRRSEIFGKRGSRRFARDSR